MERCSGVCWSFLCCWHTPTGPDPVQQDPVLRGILSITVGVLSSWDLTLPGCPIRELTQLKSQES